MGVSGGLSGADSVTRPVIQNFDPLVRACSMLVRGANILEVPVVVTEQVCALFGAVVTAAVPEGAWQDCC